MRLYASLDWTDALRLLFTAILLAVLKQMTGQGSRQATPTDTTAQHTRTLVFDLTELSDPVVLTQYYATTYSTDHNLYIRGRYMYQGNYGAGLRIVDVGDPKHPKEAGFLTEIGDAWGTYPRAARAARRMYTILFVRPVRAPARRYFAGTGGIS